MPFARQSLRTCALAALVAASVHGAADAQPRAAAAAPQRDATNASPSGVSAALQAGQQRADEDLAALRVVRPSYPFWQHVFTVPDGAVVFGSARQGELLGFVPSRGDWTSEGTWLIPDHAAVVREQSYPSDVDERRELLASVLEPVAGQIIHNPSRGLFVATHALRYGRFLEEWGTIYERFGVPRYVGLAQALVESGFNGEARSESRAIGFCQWLEPNWRHLQRLAGHPIEATNQTTQAPYCAAYLTILATKYGSFIPALSEHHAGGVNIGRTLINGERLGGASTRERYFLGSDFARELRTLSPGTFSDVYGTYGPRSYRYAEMIFGNIPNVMQFEARNTQQRIHAMRVPKAVTLTSIARVTRLSTDEIRRFNPALRSRVPAGAALYLPRHYSTLGRDIAFWHRPEPASFAAALEAFTALDVSLDEWHSAEFDAVLERFRRRFAGTNSEEGAVMATMLEYVLAGRRPGGERTILAEFRQDERILQLFEEAKALRDASLRRVAELVTD